MGRLIRKGAAAEDILDAARATLTNATAKGEPWAALAVEKLGGVLALVARIEEQREEVAKKLAPLVAALESEDEDADAALGRVGDELWNDVGRPAADPIYTVFFPGGVEAYTDGDVHEQPMRMELLAKLLEAGLHPKLEKKKGAEYAKRVRAAATKLEAATSKTRGPAAELELHERVLTALAKVTHGELTKLKRGWQAEGLTEAEIHRVLPSVGKARKGESKDSPAPTPPAPEPGGDPRK